MPRRALLHLCCAPCAIVPVRGLQQAGYEVTGVFTNPNIHPVAEYARRRDCARESADELGIRLIVRDDTYDPQAWFREVSYRENNRCFHCYRMRLETTFHMARRGGFDVFSTTLLYSKYQQHDAIRQLGQDLAGGAEAPQFHYEDWRTGWAEGIEASKALGMYRQDYCACLYSDLERRRKDLLG